MGRIGRKRADTTPVEEILLSEKLRDIGDCAALLQEISRLQCALAALRQKLSEHPQSWASSSQNPQVSALEKRINDLMCQIRQIRAQERLKLLELCGVDEPEQTEGVRSSALG